ncbi:MAG: barstar family protein [Sideroxydans sp.]|nr:barstar family protein [Sideroxydans sp.]
MATDSSSSTLAKKRQASLTPAEQSARLTAWAAQLTDSKKSGSYRLTCTLEQLRSSVALAGLRLIEVDLKGVKGKQNFIAALAAGAQFPAEFGMNWDALADALCDAQLLKATGLVLLLCNTTNSLGLAVNDREIATDIFADTVLYWQQRNTPSWIFYA